MLFTLFGAGFTSSFNLDTKVILIFAYIEVSFDGYLTFLGVPKLRFVSFLHLNRRFPKKMAFSLENGQVSVEYKAGLVRPATEAHAEEAIQALKTGKVIAVPTDTLYGFACDAWYHHLILFFLFRL